MLKQCKSTSDARKGKERKLGRPRNLTLQVHFFVLLTMSILSSLRRMKSLQRVVHFNAGAQEGIKRNFQEGRERPGKGMSKWNSIILSLTTYTSLTHIKGSYKKKKKTTQKPKREKKEIFPKEGSRQNLV